MKIFKINDKIEVVCSYENTRSGFRHLATLFIDGNEVEKDKACYSNRTWERYEYQSVLQSLINKAFKNKILSEEQKKICDVFIEKDQTDWSRFRAVSSVAKMGEIICDNQKDKNDWKKRMIKAGFPELNIPEDWDELNEEEKEKRLNGVIKIMSK